MIEHPFLSIPAKTARPGKLRLIFSKISRATRLAGFESSLLPLDSNHSISLDLVSQEVRGMHATTQQQRGRNCYFRTTVALHSNASMHVTHNIEELLLTLLLQLSLRVCMKVWACHHCVRRIYAFRPFRMIHMVFGHFFFLQSKVHRLVSLGFCSSFPHFGHPEGKGPIR